MQYSRWANQKSVGENEGLSILDLVNYGEIDCKLAGLLWILMEHRAPLLVAAGPSYAGKTTLFHALLDFLPPEVQQRPLKGYYEDFQFVDHAQPDKTYITVEEFSQHGFFDYDYLWGVKAVKAFKLLSQGYGLGATIHARTSEEVIYVLNRGLGLTLPQLTKLGIIVNLRATAGRSYDDEPVRLVSSVDLVISHQEGLAIQVLAARQYTENGFEYQTETALQQALTGKGLIGQSSINVDIETRKRFLKNLLHKGLSSRSEVRNAIRDFYRSQPK